MAIMSSPPDLSHSATAEAKIDTIMNYLYVLVEQMRYAMDNLSQDNFNENDLEDIGSLVRTPIAAELRGMEGQLASLCVSYDGFAAEITGIDARVGGLEFTIDGLSIHSANGTTYINGNHIKSGTIEGSVLSCTMNQDSSQSEGKLQFYYTADGCNDLVGSICLSDLPNGSDASAQHKLLISSYDKFVLKLQSDADTSYESVNGGVYISGKDSVRIYSTEDCVIICAPSGKEYVFRDNGIHFAGKVIA